MPKQSSDDAMKEDKIPKPKKTARLLFDIYDNGVVVNKLTYWYVHDEIEKRVSEETDPETVKKVIKNSISEDQDFLAHQLFDQLNINPRAFAQRVLGLPVEAPVEAPVETK